MFVQLAKRSSPLGKQDEKQIMGGGLVAGFYQTYVDLEEKFSLRFRGGELVYEVRRSLLFRNIRTPSLQAAIAGCEGFVVLKTAESHFGSNVRRATRAFPLKQCAS